MSLRFLTIKLFLILFASTSFAGTRLVYFGGGDSSVKSDATLFEQGFLNTARFAGQKNLPSEFFYRTELPKQVTSESASRVGQFTPQNFKAKIDALTQDILRGRIKSGEQLMVIIDTHGSPGGRPGELNISVNGEKVSDAVLMKLIDAANKKGVKVGLLGGTCYSGNLMKYMSDKVCVITGAQPDRVAYSGFWEKLMNELGNERNPNLEVAFLRARLASTNGRTIDQPMISTPAGIAVDRILQPIKSGIFYRDDIESDARNPECRGPLSPSLEKSMRGIYQIRDRTILGIIPTKEYTSRFEILNGLYQRYQTLRNRVQGHLLVGEEPRCEKAPMNPAGVPDCQSYQRVTSNMGQGYSLDCKSEMFKDLVEPCKKMNNDQMKYAHQLALTPGYRQWLDAEKNYKPTLDAMSEVSKAIVAQERLIYDGLYKNALTQFKGTNACRDFKL